MSCASTAIHFILEQDLSSRRHAEEHARQSFKSVERDGEMKLSNARDELQFALSKAEVAQQRHADLQHEIDRLAHKLKSEVQRRQELTRKLQQSKMAIDQRVTTRARRTDWNGDHHDGDDDDHMAITPRFEDCGYYALPLPPHHYPSPKSPSRRRHPLLEPGYFSSSLVGGGFGPIGTSVSIPLSSHHDVHVTPLGTSPPPRGRRSASPPSSEHQWWNKPNV